MDPNVNRGKSQACLETCGDALPADDQAPVFLLKPGHGPLGLEPWHHLCAGPPPIFLGLPDALRDLGPAPPLPELLAPRFRLIACLRGDDAPPVAGAAPLARAALDGSKRRQHVGPLVPLGRRGAVGQGHATALREPVEQHPCAFPAAGAARAAPLPRGKQRHPRRHTPHTSCRALLRYRDSAPAARPRGHPPAPVAPSDAWRSSTPMGGRAGHHTSGNLSSRWTTKCAESSETAPGASLACAAAVPGARPPRTSATPHHSHLPIVLPYCPPMFR